MPADHTAVRRIRMKQPDQDLRTTRLVGRGWSWECDCGESGGWNGSRDEAIEYARLHRLYKHGVR